MDDNDVSIEQTMQDTLTSIESGGTNAPASQAPNQGPPSTPAGNSGFNGQPQEPWRSMPKSWRREMGDYWTRQDPRVQQYIHEREEQALRGITQYKSQVDRWNQTLQPYSQLIQQHNIDPHQVVANLAAIHTILKFGSPQQRMQAIQMLDRDYGLRQYFGQNGVQQPQNDMTPITTEISAIKAQLAERAFGDAANHVESFLANPANKYAAQAAPKMMELLESGRIPPGPNALQEAYDIAVKTDPVLFERIIAERVQAATRSGGRPPTNVRPSGVPSRTTGGQLGTIEDTMRATLANIQSR